MTVRPLVSIRRALAFICTKQDRPSGQDPRWHREPVFSVSADLPALGAEPLIGAMDIFSLTCAGTGHRELDGNS